MTLLNVLIVVIATLIALLFLIWLLFRFALPWWLTRKFGALSAMPQTGLAARITLAPTAQPWRQMRTAERIGQMLAVGFEEIGRYLVPEMPGMRLWSGYHPQSGVVAAIYDHDSVPVFFDIVRVHADYRTFTVSSNPVHDPANLAPGNTCIANPDWMPDEAFAAMAAQPVEGETMRVDAENFEAVFIELYARSMDYLLAKRTPDAETMRIVGERMSAVTGEPLPDLSEAQMAMAVRMQQAARIEALEQAVIDRFLESGQIGARDWERVRDAAIVVHDLLDREDAANLACSGSDLDDVGDLIAQVLAEALSPIDTFERVAANLPAGQRPRLLGEVDHPLYAQVLVVPGAM